MRRTALALQLAVAAAAAITVGCGDTINVIQPGLDLHASVTVLARAYPVDAAVAGATWQLMGTAVSGTSDAAGIIALSDLSAGEYDLLVQAAGRASVRSHFVVRGTTTNVHLVRRVYLPDKTRGLSIVAYAGSDGRPAANTPLRLTWMLPTSDSDVSYPTPEYEVIEDASIPSRVQTDATGQVTVRGLPSLSGYITPLPADANADGQIDNPRAESIAMDLTASETTRLVIVLHSRYFGGYSPTTVVSTNLPMYYFTQPTFGDSIAFLVFSQAMDPTADATTVSYTPQFSPTGSQPIVGQFRWVTPVRLELDVAAARLTANSEYTLNITSRDASGAPGQWRYEIVWVPR